VTLKKVGGTKTVDDLLSENNNRYQHNFSALQKTHTTFGQIIFNSDGIFEFSALII
jgi:VCBS repeat-containing protein